MPVHFHFRRRYACRFLHGIVLPSRVMGMVLSMLMLSLCGFYPPATAQEILSLSGEVVDATNGRPVPFAQLSLLGTTLGTSSNEDGRFMLSWPAGKGSDTLLVASMGYITLRIPVQNNAGEVRLNLVPSPIQLAEVEIVGLTPGEVIRRAVSRIPQNYGPDSVLLKAYVRIRKTFSRRLAEYTEAIVENLKDGYYHYDRNDLDKKGKNSNWPRFSMGRVISDTLLVNAIGDAGKDAYCLSCYFRDDLVEFYPRSILDEKEFIDHELRMKEEISEGTGKVYHITFDQKEKVPGNRWKGELFIEPVGFAILKIIIQPSPRGYLNWEKNRGKRLYTLDGTYGWIREMPLGRTEVTYARKGEFWTLNTIRNDYQTTFTLASTGRKLNIGYKSDVIITDVTRDPLILRSFTGDKQTGVGQRWDQITGKPDDAFWNQANFLPMEEGLARQIEELMRR